jgi:hypothetical protein
MCPQKRKAIIISKYMEDSVVKSVDILLKDDLIRNLKINVQKNIYIYSKFALLKREMEN